MQAYSKYFKNGNKIKIEVEILPTYLILEGIINTVQDGYLFVDIDGEYLQKDERKTKCTIYLDNKICVFSTDVKAFIDGKLILKEPPLKDIQILQRRKFVRVDTDIEVDCFLVGFQDRAIESDKRFPAVIKNISGGGVLLNTKLSIPKDTILLFELELEETLLLTVRVLRNEVDSDNSNNLGCEFIGITDEKRQKIIKYVNKLQFI